MTGCLALPREGRYTSRMKIIVIGARGTIGAAVVRAAPSSRRHRRLALGRSHGAAVEGAMMGETLKPG